MVINESSQINEKIDKFESVGQMARYMVLKMLINLSNYSIRDNCSMEKLVLKIMRRLVPLIFDGLVISFFQNDSRVICETILSVQTSLPRSV